MLVNRLKINSFAGLIFILFLVCIYSVPAGAQRLCENNDYPVAKIAPCTGPSGTEIKVTMFRADLPAPATLAFKRTVSNATYADVRIPVVSGNATSQPQLCINGPGKWDVYLIDSTGVSRGKIGAFWPECGGSGGVVVNGPTGGGSTKSSSGGGAKKKPNVKNQNKDDDGAIPPIKPAGGPKAPVGNNEKTKTITGVGDPCAAANRKANLALALRRIRDYQAAISRRQDEMTNMYYYSGAVQTLMDAFRAAGVSNERMSYADSWGKMGIGLTWSQETKAYYESQRDALEKLYDQISRRGYLSEGEMMMIDREMGRWNDGEKAISGQFEAYVKVFVKLARLMDEKEAALAPLNARYSQLSQQRPFPAFAVDEVNARRREVSKQYDDRYNAIENGELSQVRSEIIQLAKARYLQSIADIRPCGN